MVAYDMLQNINDMKNELKPQDVDKHVLALDGIRGTAIGMVLLYHLLSSAQALSPVARVFSAFREAGWIGVDLFFCLSGFLITGILFDTIRDPHYFRNFYARRFLRIFPLYYAVLLCIVFYVIFSGHGSGSEFRHLSWVAVFLQNTPTYLNDAHGTVTYLYTAHFWSLAVEEQFYFVWPVLVFLLRDRKRLMITAALLFAFALLLRFVLVLHGASLDNIYRYTLCRQDALLAGAWLSLAVRGPARAVVLRVCKLVLPMALGFLVVLNVRTGDLDFDVNRGLATYGYSIIAVGCAALLGLALTRGSATSRLMAWTPLRFLGKYSFGIYIVDSIVEHCVEPWFFDGTAHARPMFKVLFHTLYLGVVIGASISLAMLSFRFYEKPILRLKRFFNYNPHLKKLVGGQ